MDIQKINSNQLSLETITKKNKTNKPRQQILDEETYSEKLEKIIERDFFPDLAKHRAQAEYLDAVERKDHRKLYEIRQKYSRPKTGVRTPSIYGTPSTFETPEGRPTTTPITLSKDVTTDTPQTEASSLDVEPDETPAHNPEPTDALKGVSLDQFLAHNTSEDNVSFVHIMNEAEKKHRVKHAWLYEKEQNQLTEQEQYLALPSIEEQAVASTSKDLQTWTYVPRNAVMYVPDGVPESAKEKIERMGMKEQQIVHRNTGFAVDPFNQDKSRDAISQAASLQAMMMQGRIGADGKEILPTQSPRVAGYGFVATPSPAPGVDASPLMTWGEIEGTPFRLDGGDTPISGRMTGPTFKIPEVPRRDRLLHELVDNASKAYRAKKQEALKQCQASFARSPSPRSRSSSSKTDRLQHFSPAAQRLAASKFGIRPNTGDKALRASYTPSPNRRSSSDLTPVPSPGGTPKGGRTPGGGTPSSAAGTPKSSVGTPKLNQTPKRAVPPSQPASITDDLLQLPKRPRAHEFF